ncbi:DUF7683 domain-containing protein [Streptomyces geranii]|uniref:DUF7683 domain-containing protein n=1 Tax=Streptomyces geranii TaxID=2058923 RepID=UPI000D0277F6|nr:hypothetical protein [Streptomyces geranii]
MRFLITRYEKGADTPDSVVDVVAMSLDDVSELLGIPPARFTDVYPLKGSHADALRRLIGIGLDLDHYEYFIEAEAD